MADAWYYSKNGNSTGPVPRAKMSALLSSGEISGATLVWTAGMTGWEPASNALGTPPPLPSGAPPVQNQNA